MHFEAPEHRPTSGTSKYTDAQFAAYAAKLKAFVEGGGNLVLTDGALQALPYLFAADQAHRRGPQHQLRRPGRLHDQADDLAGRAGTDGNTLADPLAKNVSQARRAVQHRPAPPDLRAHADRLLDPERDRRQRLRTRRCGWSTATPSRRPADASRPPPPAARPPDHVRHRGRAQAGQGRGAHRRRAAADPDRGVRPPAGPRALRGHLHRLLRWPRTSPTGAPRALLRGSETAVAAENAVAARAPRPASRPGASARPRPSHAGAG